MQTINLAGPDGNALKLMTYAMRFTRQLGWTRDQQGALIQEMQSGDYEHLLRTFHKEFRYLVEFENLPEGLDLDSE